VIEVKGEIKGIREIRVFRAGKDCRGSTGSNIAARVEEGIDCVRP
jgi:hypothetical protein